MIDLNQTISIILVVLRCQLKDRYFQLDKKQDPIVCCKQETQLVNTSD